MRLAALLLASTLSLFAAKTLDVYFIDVEGGQATLFVSPSGQSMLIDAGWPGFNARDANRIIAAAKHAKVKKIDYVVITHHHTDHVGGTKQLAERFPVGTFIDKGPTVEKSALSRELTQVYEEAIAKAQGHKVVKPGDTIPVKGLDVKVLTAEGEAIAANGPANPACAGVERKPDDPSENARSLGTLISYGKFRMVDLGDLTWNKELDLVCPSNRIGGPVDVYLTTHHGLDASNAPPVVAAAKPRVAIMNNGARKGGVPAAWKVIKASTGLEDLWQIHFAVSGGKETNAADMFIANLEESNDQGNYIKLSANADGSFVVSNSRNKYSKTYAAR